MSQTRDHYSYRVYADPAVARNFDSDRFGGGIGEMIKLAQERTVFSVLGDVKDWKVIDVGAGTGRFSLPFLEMGASEVSACDASQQMLDVLREKTTDPRLKLHVIDAHELQFPDRYFDCSLSFRMLLHVIDWKKALSELCRVSKDRVVFDFPPRHGFLRMAPVFHWMRGLVSKDVQKYRTFPIDEMLAELEKNGFVVETVDPGFFLPLIVYRKINSTSFMRGAENLFRKTGLTSGFGSPITLFARRKK